MTSKVKQLLLVDDEQSIRVILAKELNYHGVEVTTAEDVPAARKALKELTPDVILLDICMPGIDGATFLKEIRENPEAPPVVIMTGHANVELAVQCMRDGAADLLTKPSSVKEILHTLEQVVETQHLRDTARTLLTRAVDKSSSTGTRLLGKSPAMGQVRKLIKKVSQTDESVLILGENGTGKEIVAQELQKLSHRSQQPFLTVNCAAVSESLLESELFGHEKGAFSGAIERRLGYFELADEGTIFLDEIGDMPMSMQAKLLRVLQSGEIRRVGGTKTMTVDVRVIAATNKPLMDEISNGHFREDLFHRINTIMIEVPALRDRSEDIELLIGHFISELGPHQEEAPKFSDEALEILKSYSWPGNVRELRNVVRRALILAENDVMEIDVLPSTIYRETSQKEAVVEATSSTEDLTSLTLEEVERRHILSVLKANKGSKAATARALGISVRTLYNRFDAWGINEDSQDD